MKLQNKGDKMSLTFIDLFSGIGGFRKGMEMAGHKCLGHCEWDKYANMSYAAMHEPREDEWFANDIRDVRAREIPRADVWCFGFPCQDISVAGKQLGFDGKRSSLFFAVTRLIRDTEQEDRPKYLFIENVKNLLSVNGGSDFLKLHIELDEIGYDCEWSVINSKDHGVPQNRERVFIIGHLRGRGGREVFPIGRSSTETTINQILKGKQQVYRVYGTDGISPTLDTHKGGGHEPKIMRVGKINSSQDGQVFDTKGISQCLSAGHGNTPKVAIPVSSPSIIVKNQIVVGNFRIRKLTPKECFRLQGWPDEYYERAASVCSNSQLYKQAGNGVTVTVIYAIAQKLK